MSMYLMLLVLLPIAAGVAAYLLPKKVGQVLSIGIQSVHLYLAVTCFIRSMSEPLMLELGGWAAPIGIVLYADRLSAVLVLLVSFLFLALLIFNLHRHYVNKQFFMLFLLLEGLLCGIFLMDDLFSIFVLVEVSTMVVALLIMFKRDSRSMYDGLIYLLVNIFSMTLYLFGLAILYKHTGTFSFRVLSSVLHDITNVKALYLPYAMLMTSVCLKAALMPLFSWLPKAHGTPSAPSVVSAVLSGIYVKGGIYLYLRLSHSFSIINIRPFFMVCGIITAIVGFMLAIAQTDIKLILSYHTVSQLGLIMLSINMGDAMAQWGGVYHIVSHALFKTVLFLVAGVIIDEYDTRNVYEIRGVFKRMPWVSVAGLAAILGITGAPLFNGSISKYMIAHGAEGELMQALLIFINLGTLVSFVKFAAIFRGESKKRAKVALNRQIILILLGTLCLLGGVLGTPAIKLLFGVEVHMNTGEYIMKSLIFLGTLGAAVLIYFFGIKKWKGLKKVAGWDLGFNGIALSIMVFFVVVLGYLWIGI